MNRITPRRIKLFVGVMTAVAVVVYLPLAGCRQRRAQAAAEQQRAVEQEVAVRVAATNAVVEHAQFLARYLDTTFTKKPGVRAVALSVSFSDGRPDRIISDYLIGRFKADNNQILPSFFTGSFISDGLFDSAFDGPADISKKLELGSRIDEMLLARAAIEYTTNGTELQNVITATVRLDIATLPTSGNETGGSWFFTAVGTGFNPMAARAAAEDRLTKQIGEDKRMSL